jgi:aspartate aminotransferase-like enzyme
MGMLEAVEIALEEGLDARFTRTKRLADATRATAEALGLRLFAAAGHRSDTVTAVRYPDLPEADKKVRVRMKEEMGVLIAGGQDETKGKVFRVGHMANANAAEIIAFVHALEVCLADLGHRFERGAGLQAASAVLGTR